MLLVKGELNAALPALGRFEAEGLRFDIHFHPVSQHLLTCRFLSITGPRLLTCPET
jgi:hypothetical protein